MEDIINVLIASESPEGTGEVVIQNLFKSLEGTEFEGRINFAQVNLTDHEVGLVLAGLKEYITIIVLSRVVNPDLTSIYLHLLGSDKPHIEFAVREGDTDGDDIPVLWEKSKGIVTTELEELFLSKLRELKESKRSKNELI